MNNDKSKLYLSVKAETHEGYYDNYVLSYPLTEKEYDDLFMLHTNKYIQAGSFIQELDSQKQAKVESHVNVEVETLNSLGNRLAYLAKQHLRSTNAKIDVVSANQNYEFTVNVKTLPSMRDGMIVDKQELHVAD